MNLWNVFPEGLGDGERGRGNGTAWLLNNLLWRFKG